jgi:putative ABC transport system substrate-binding protein
MNRRTLIAAVALASPLPARAQQASKIARVGLLVAAPLEDPVVHENFGAIRQGLADPGYVEGRNIVFEQRGGDRTAERLAAIASELVSLKVDVIVAIATPAARAAQHS